MCHRLRLPSYKTLHFDSGFNMPPSCCKLEPVSNVPECARMCHECASECAKSELAATVRSTCAACIMMCWYACVMLLRSLAFAFLLRTRCHRGRS